MSDYGEEIINRLSENSALRNSDNPMRKIIVDGIGEWFQQQDDTDFLEQFFLQEATGKYLDLHGKTYNVLRKLGESDEEYRQRIIYIVLGKLTVDYLRDVYDVKLYSHKDSFSILNNDLCSDNPYYSKNGFMGIADDIVKDILNKKFVIGSELTWL